MKKIILFIFILSIYMPVFANSDIQDKITPIINSWLNNNMSNTQFIEEIDFLNKNMDDPKNKSLLHLYTGQAYFELEDKKKSITELETAINFANNALSNGEDSKQFRILAEAGSLIMLQKGLSYIIKNSGKVNSYAQKAVELNSDNTKAKFIIAQGLINAPKLFGGDFDKGLKDLIEILNTPTISEEEKFYINITLSEIYKSNKDKDKAITYCKDALSLYPNNEKANNILKELIN